MPGGLYLQLPLPPPFFFFSAKGIWTYTIDFLPLFMNDSVLTREEYQGEI